MLGHQVKKLIIVTGEKENVYAEFLSSLIALRDDDKENDKIIGIIDGSIEAVVWSEDVFKDNKIQLGSNTKIIFIGKTKAAEPFVPSIRFNPKMEKYGIYLGWLSNKAVIYTDAGTLMNNKELYGQFYDKYAALAEQFDNDVADSDKIRKAKHVENLGETIGNRAQALGNFFSGLFGKKSEAELTQDTNVTNFFNISAKLEAGNLIPDQQFRFALLSFYLNGLSAFMGIDK